MLQCYQNSRALDCLVALVVMTAEWVTVNQAAQHSGSSSGIVCRVANKERLTALRIRRQRYWRSLTSGLTEYHYGRVGATIAGRDAALGLPANLVICQIACGTMKTTHDIAEHDRSNLDRVDFVFLNTTETRAAWPATRFAISRIAGRGVAYCS